MSEYGWFPPPSKPIEVDGGLRARSARGEIGEAWWSRRFINVLEEIGVGSRLQRGKNYARRGQVLSLDIRAGMVTAVVQGSRPTPYRARIGLAPFDKRGWSAVENTLAETAWYAATLLAGEMPDDIETVFAEHQLDLFPAEHDDLSMDCNCPDWEVPCKHLAAALFLLGEEFDSDPFLILAWRGREREELLANLAAARATEKTPAVDQSDSGARPLEECLDSYFLPTSVPDLADTPARGAPATAYDPGHFLEQLPEPDLRIRDCTLPELLMPAYQHFHQSTRHQSTGHRSA